MAGSNPENAQQVNATVGGHLRQFIELRDRIDRDQAWLAARDLKTAPYNMSVDDEADIKSAINGLDTALGAVDLTFINRLTGLG